MQHFSSEGDASRLLPHGIVKEMAAAAVGANGRRVGAHPGASEKRPAAGGPYRCGKRAELLEAGICNPLSPVNLPLVVALVTR